MGVESLNRPEEDAEVAETLLKLRELLAKINPELELSGRVDGTGRHDNDSPPQSENPEINQNQKSPTRMVPANEPLIIKVQKSNETPNKAPVVYYDTVPKFVRTAQTFTEIFKQSRRQIAAGALAITAFTGLSYMAFRGNESGMTKAPSYIFKGDELINPGGASRQATFVAKAIKTGAEARKARNNKVVVIGDEEVDIMSQEQGGNLKAKLRAIGLDPTDIQSTTETVKPSRAQAKIDADKIRSAGTVVLEFGTGTTRGGSIATDAQKIAGAVEEIKNMNPSANIEVMNTYAVGPEAATAARTNTAISEDAKRLKFELIDWHHEASTAPAVEVSPETERKINAVEKMVIESESSQNSNGRNASTGRRHNRKNNQKARQTATIKDATLRRKIVNVAKGQLRLWERQPGYQTSNNPYAAYGYKKYSNGLTQVWCADFVSWVDKKAGRPFRLPPQYPTARWLQSYIPYIVDGVLKYGGGYTYHPAGGYRPEPGDDAIHGSGYHINIVTKVDGNKLTLIGGDQPSVAGSDNTTYPGTSRVSTEYTTIGDPDITGYISPR